MVPARALSAYPLETFLARLGESHEESVHEAIDRLLHAAETVGLDVPPLFRIFDRGITFKQLLVIIESKMQCSQKAA